MKTMWACGVTAVQSRQKDLLPQTLLSISKAGFPSPRIFLDGAMRSDLEGEVTYRHPQIFAFGNWLLGAMELYVRHPAADLFAMFQDDIVLCRNVRQFIEARSLPTPTSYLSLYCAGAEEASIQGKPRGWYESPPITGQDYFDLHENKERRQQAGQGALALVFTNEGLRMLLRHQHMIDRPTDVMRGTKNIDGGVVTAMNKAGWRCWFHAPSLCQHKGERSTVSGLFHRPSNCFPGESFDAMDLLNG